MEGEQYLALNHFGIEQRMVAHPIMIPRNGHLNPGDLDRLVPLPGAPYRWRDRHRESR